MRSPHRIVLLLVGVLAAAGCSSQDEPAREASTGSAPPSASTPAVPTESAAAAESAELDACELLEPADYRRFVRPALRASTSEGHGLDGDLGTMNTCVVSSGPLALFRFGYSTDPGAWSTIERRTRPSKSRRSSDKTLSKVGELIDRDRQDIPNLADEAFLFTSFLDYVLYALEDEVAYRMEVESLNMPEGITAADYAAVMVTLLSNASAGVATARVQLPPQCPPADSPEVVDLLGEVTHAYGSAYQGKPASCAYTSSEGRTLRAGSTLYPSAAAFDQEAVLPEEAAGVEVLDAPPGPTSGIKREGRNWVYHAAVPARLETVGARTGTISWGPRPTGAVDRKAFLAFVDAYRALASDQLGVDY